MKQIYLDYAAATPVDPDVLAAMEPYFSDVFYNPSAHYSGARSAKSALEEARHSVAKSIGGRSSEIIFTAGGTESANLAIKGVMDLYQGSNCVMSAIEHDAVRRPASGYASAVCGVDQKGRVDTSQLQELINEDTVLVSIMLANNEVGTVQPLKEIVELIHRIRKARRKRGSSLPLYVHTDACQAPNYLDINVARLGVDLMTLNGGKIYGPKQSGALYCRAGVRLQSQIQGGGQEFGVRSGTENVAFAVGFARALDAAVAGRASHARAAREMQREFIEKLESQCGGELIGHAKMRLPNNILMTFKGADNERVLFSLDEQGISAASGSACSASKDEVSHVLSALGMSDEQARSSIRFSIGRNTARSDIDATVKAMAVALTA